MPDAPSLDSIAGVIVRTLPNNLPAVTARLSALPGVDVHHQEAATGRFVITIETTDIDGEQESLERVRREAGVISAELVYHVVTSPGHGVAERRAAGNPR